jgi:hypothetical protein
MVPGYTVVCSGTTAPAMGSAERSAADPGTMQKTATTSDLTAAVPTWSGTRMRNVDLSVS